MYQLINKKGESKTGILRHLGDWLNPLAAQGVDLRPFVFSPEWGDAPGREVLLASGMEEEEVDEVMLVSKEEYCDSQALLSAVVEAEFLAGSLVRHEGDRTPLLRDLLSLKRACEQLVATGESIQIFAIPYDDEESEEEDEKDDFEED